MICAGRVLEVLKYYRAVIPRRTETETETIDVLGYGQRQHARSNAACDDTLASIRENEEGCAGGDASMQPARPQRP
jgi:hypothetical protein